MEKAIKQIIFLNLILSLNLVWAGSSFDDIAFFQNPLSTSGECSDFSNPFESFHSVYCEDDVFMNDPKVKSGIFSVRNDKDPVLTDNFLTEYLNSIWQPPKFS